MVLVDASRLSFGFMLLRMLMSVLEECRGGMVSGGSVLALLANSWSSY